MPNAVNIPLPSKRPRKNHGRRTPSTVEGIRQNPLFRSLFFLLKKHKTNYDYSSESNAPYLALDGGDEFSPTIS